MLICVIPGDVYLDHLVKRVSAGCPHSKVTLSFCSSQVLWGTCLRVCKSFPPQIFPNFSIHQWIFSTTVIAVVTDLWISFIFLFLPIHICLNFTEKKTCHVSSIYSLIWLLIYISTFPWTFILFYELYSNAIIIYSIEKLFQLWPLGALSGWLLSSFLPCFLTLWDQKFQTTHIFLPQF